MHHRDDIGALGRQRPSDLIGIARASPLDRHA
jgi:hypothetical protein